MIDVKVFGSSSKGNCYIIDDGQTQLMIEAGIRFDLVKQGMGFDLSRLKGCVISHEHQDHSKYIAQVVNDAAFNIYGSYGTLNSLNVPIYKAKVLEEKLSVRVGTWWITSFGVHHDAVEPTGFIFENGIHERLLFVTDTYFVQYKFKNISHMMVEMNYSKKILAENSGEGFAKVLKNRIIASHFEMENSLKFIKSNLSDKLQEIWLLHLSAANSDPTLFKDAVQKMTGVPVHIAGR